MEIGEVCRIKVLGSFCMADQKEIDWKVLAIKEKDAGKVNAKDIFLDKRFAGF